MTEPSKGLLGGKLLLALRSLRFRVVLHTHSDSAYLDLMREVMHAEYRSKGPFCRKLGVMFLWLVGSSVGLVSQRLLFRIQVEPFLFFSTCFFSFSDNNMAF